MTKVVRPSEQCVERFLDQALGARVHAGGCFVQNQDARVGQRGAGDREQLALSLAQTGAAFAQHGLIFLRQALDERIGVGQFGGGVHFLVGRVRSPKADVVHHGGAEQEGILQHDADLLAQRFGGDVAHVDAVDLDRAVGHIVEARQQVDDGGLARAGRADDGDGLPGFGGEGDVLQHRHAILVFMA